MLIFSGAVRQTKFWKKKRSRERRSPHGKDESSTFPSLSFTGHLTDHANLAPKVARLPSRLHRIRTNPRRPTRNQTQTPARPARVQIPLLVQTRIPVAVLLAPESVTGSDAYQGREVIVLTVVTIEDERGHRMTGIDNDGYRSISRSSFYTQLDCNCGLRCIVDFVYSNAILYCPFGRMRYR